MASPDEKCYVFVICLLREIVYLSHAKLDLREIIDHKTLINHIIFHIARFLLFF